MEPGVRVTATASLRENYTNEKHKAYYLVLFATVESQDASKYVPPKVTVEVPITEEQYNSLKEKISKSPAEYPFLRVQGDLELILDSACLC
ncbi:MAG: hypothetical protein NTW17_02980 [Candidatus Pacearchaeota archaeon]|nr:hypothetical protein [Candidatus Pacearchaeota archaeon]